jgi:hypothetical protein
VSFCTNSLEDEDEYEEEDSEEEEKMQEAEDGRDLQHISKETSIHSLEQSHIVGENSLSIEESNNDLEEITAENAVIDDEDDFTNSPSTESDEDNDEQNDGEEGEEMNENFTAINEESMDLNTLMNESKVKLLYQVR